MSGELSKIQQQSLAGQIIAKLDAQDSQQGDNKIDVSVWNKFFGEKSGREGTISKAEKDANLKEDGTIDFKDAFDFVMKRIFKAANKVIGNEAWQDEGKRKEAVDNVAREWLKDAEKTDKKDGTNPVEDGGKAGAKDEAAKKQLSADTKWSLSQLTPKDRDALNKTKAGQIVLNLDAQDGADGFISQATWDEFREQAGIKDSSKSIQSRITLKNALRSINAYLNAAARKANASKEEGAKEITADSIAYEWSAKYTGEKAFKTLTVEGIENPQQAEEVVQPKEPTEDELVVGNAILKAKGIAYDIEQLDTNTIDNELNNYSTEGKTKDAVEDEKDAIQKKINALKKQVNDFETQIRQLETNINGKDDVNRFAEAKASIEAADSAITTLNGTIENLQNKLNTISTEGLQTNDQVQKEKDAKAVQDKKAELTKKGAKPQKPRVINGVEQSYYKYTDEKGETHRVIVDNKGNEEELIVLSRNVLKIEDMITKSLYDSELQRYGLKEIPKGVDAFVGFDDKKQPKLMFKTKGGERIHKNRLKFMSEKIDDNFRAKIKTLNTGITGEVKYEINDDGKVTIIASDNYFNGIKSDLMAHHMSTKADSNGDYHMGPFKAKTQQDVHNKYYDNAHLLAQHTAVYQDLANKLADQLTAREKQFMAIVEKELFEFYNAE